MRMLEGVSPIEEFWGQGTRCASSRTQLGNWGGGDVISAAPNRRPLKRIAVNEKYRGGYAHTWAPMVAGYQIAAVRQIWCSRTP